MPDKKCNAESSMTVHYDRNVHGVASCLPLNTTIPLGACAADQRSELNPIDLMALGLASCLLILMGKTAAKENLDIVGARADVSYTLDNYRITAFNVGVHLPKALGRDAQQKLEAASRECPVYLAIHQSVNVTVKFDWPK